MQKARKGKSGYSIYETEYSYNIDLTSIRDNVSIGYEYSKTNETLEEVEKFLKEHSFKEIVKEFDRRWVYCSYVEEIQ